MWERMTIRFIIAAVILTGIGGYAFYESRNIRTGPVITVETPATGSVSNSAITLIKGSVENSVRLKMNDRDIAVDEHRVFNEKFVLSDGSNVVKISAEDRFGRTTETLVEILYNEPIDSLVKR
jgi:hypothetical protein